MPKVHPSRVVLAKHEPLGLLERITISNKFKEVGKPRRIPKPVHQSVISRPFDPELAQEAQEEIDRKGLLARLTQHHSLLDRISASGPSLLERMDLDPTPIIEVKPLPNIRFRRTKILLRTEEYNNLFAATADRLDPLYDKLKQDGVVSEEIRVRLERMGDEFDTLYHGLEERAHALTNKQWRCIKRDLKRIGRISFAQPTTRFAVICKELVDLDISFNYEE